MPVEEYLYDIDDFTYKLGYQLFAEFFGTFVLSFLIQSCAITGAANDVRSDQFLSTGVCICCTIVIAVYLCGPTSGAHINPAMSASAVLSGRMNALKALLFSLSQIAGESRMGSNLLPSPYQDSLSLEHPVPNSKYKSVLDTSKCKSSSELIHALIHVNFFYLPDLRSYWFYNCQPCANSDFSLARQGPIPIYIKFIVFVCACVSILYQFCEICTQLNLL